MFHPKNLVWWSVPAAWIGLFPTPCRASPFFRLTEVGEQRLECVSFFLLVIVLSTLLLRWIWNSLAAEWQSLPRLTVSSALAVSTLWGMLFTLLAMSFTGATELMIPGPWEIRDGVHSLANAPRNDPADEPKSGADERRLQIAALKGRLWEYADRFGSLPRNVSSSTISADDWRTPGPVKVAYLYRYAKRGDGTPIAWEPQAFGDRQFVLYSDGTILHEEHESLHRKLTAAGWPTSARVHP